MTGLLSSLAIGTAVAIISFLVFYNLFHWDSKKSGFMSAALVIGIYVPLAVFNWPGGDVFSIHLAIYGIVPYMLGIITHYREQALDQEQRKNWFHWIPALFVVFFLIVIVVNMTLVSLSTSGMSSSMLQWLLPKQEGAEYTSQFPGVISHDYQEKEHQYNAYLEKLKKQKARGWQIKHGWLVTPVQNEPSIFQLEAFDKEGHIISGLEANIKFLRPSNFKLDKEFTMKEVADGVYQQSVSFELPGNWDVVIQLHKGEAEHELRGDTFVEDAVK